MPTIKHPCPHCGTYINRDVVACPMCGRQDPFTPGRCESCHAVVEDPSWVACPRCGKPVGAAAVAAAAASATPGAIPGWSQAASSAPVIPAPVAPNPVTPAAATGTCAACGSALASGARFCRDCGTPVT
jgi:predicted amidophosphoribosyltransferase